ncbi:zinc-dependent metalloprotease family protein [Aquimarina addita]|uniref:Zinc-dependent metalloprotease family protein n=1 Tax=Aquimarina addita TaxID=870485 RepID=A0ABP7XGD7_9FLAO
MKTQLSIITAMFMITFGFSQDFWKKSDNQTKNQSTLNSRAELPLNTLFTLDVTGIKQSLEKSPLRGKSAASPLLLSFPNAKGEMEVFSVFEASVMHPELAAKFPEIKSYAGQGITDPTAKIRFSVSPIGLQSMRMGSENTIFIEPVTKSGDLYTVYSRSEKPAISKKFSCLVDENTPNLTTSSVQNRNADDSTLRTFRLAVSTNGEYAQFHGGTVASTMAAINTTMTRVNGVFENDFAVTMQLIPNNDDVVYTNASTDPYTGSYNSQLQATLTSVIGEANYDIGHVFILDGDNGNAGCIGCVCVDGSKGSAFTSRSTPVGDEFDIDYVAHEMGHQFGANHTFSFRNEGTNAHFEPGSGTTIMGYAGITGATDVQQNSDPYFHFFSIEQVTDYIKSTSCQVETNTGNAVPTVDAGTDLTIPSGTPFVLTGTASDADGDALTYCWEQADENDSATTYPSVTSTSGVSFRSYNPTTSNERYFPRLETIKTGATSWQWEAVPDVSRDLNFRLTVRDNKAGGAGNNSDDMTVSVTASAGPFVVNSPNTNVSWEAGSAQVITWDVAGTTGNGINAANVDILLSTDGGDSYPIALATGVANDGSHSIIVPNEQGTENRIMVKGSGNIFFDISDSDFEIDGETVPDTEDPTVPTDLAASNETQSSIDLSWTAATDNVAVAEYDVYQGDDLIASTTETTYTVVGLTPSTTYSFKVLAKDAAGNSSDFSSIITASTTEAGAGCAGGISSYPYTEGFESGLGAWTQATDDDINWTIDSNGTPSNNTGPSSATEGSFYAYIEASGNGTGYPTKNAILNSPCFDLSGTTQATFSFQYHMFGSAMGTLNLEASSDDGISWTSIWSETGNQGNSWFTETINLVAYTGESLQLRFNGTTGTSWSGDMTVDDISLTTGSITNPSCTDVDLSITLDDYPQETSWQITDSSNNVIASGGTYGSQPDGSTITVTECLDAGTYTFRIDDTYGDGICCSYGNGSYSLTSNGTTLASGGQFGSFESTTFTIGGTLAKGAQVDEFKTTQATKISIFPTLLKESNIINVSTPDTKVSYSIYDLQGRVISQGPVNNKVIEVNSIQSGRYFVTLTVDQKRSNHSFIKE